MFGEVVPASTTLAGVMIDDFGVVQQMTPGSSEKADLEMMESADRALDAAGLLEKEEKKQRSLPGGRIWGGFLGGPLPWASAGDIGYSRRGLSVSESVGASLRQLELPYASPTSFIFCTFSCIQVAIFNIFTILPSYPITCA